MKKNKPRIAVFIDWFSPGFKAGGPLRSVVSFVETFTGQAEFLVITSDRDHGDSKPYEGVEADTWIERPFGKIFYSSPKFRRSEEWRKLILGTVADVYYFNSCFSRDFTIVPLWLTRSKMDSARIVVAPRGTLGKGALAYKPVKKKIFLMFASVTGLFKGVWWQATSPKEKDDIQRVFGSGSNIVVAPNFSSVKFISAPREKVPGKLKLVFLSRISPIKNLHEALDILSGMRINGSIDFSIYGPVEDKAYWQLCQKKFEDLPAGITVNYSGAVSPERAGEVFSEAHLFLFPTSHENFGHVVLESLAAGCPVLLSDQTPWRGLDQKGVGADFPVSEKGSFQKKIGEFLSMDQEQFNLVSSNCIRLAKERTGDPELLQSNKSLFLINS